MRTKGLNILSLVAIGILIIQSTAVAQGPVPRVGTNMVIRLDNGISTRTARVGDRFSATVISPGEYADSIVEGHISQIDRSGRLSGKTEMSLDFDTIRTRDGYASPLNAELLGIRQSESVKVVDSEGHIESGSRGQQTIKRGAIGAAVGGVLGGLLGGGKGALVGILLGGGAGAGSVYIEGEKELRLDPGTELEIQTVGRSHARRSNRGEYSPYDRSTVMEVQRALNSRGYNIGVPNGVLGPRTRSALAQFQRDNNLSVTRQIDRDTLDRLGIHPEQDRRY